MYTWYHKYNVQHMQSLNWSQLPSFSIHCNSNASYSVLGYILCRYRGTLLHSEFGSLVLQFFPQMIISCHTWPHTVTLALLSCSSFFSQDSLSHMAAHCDFGSPSSSYFLNRGFIVTHGCTQWIWLSSLTILYSGQDSLSHMAAYCDFGSPVLRYFLRQGFLTRDGSSRHWQSPQSASAGGELDDSACSGSRTQHVVLGHGRSHTTPADTEEQSRMAECNALSKSSLYCIILHKSALEKYILLICEQI